MSRLRVRLFPLPGNRAQAPSWLPTLAGLVQQELRRYEAEEPDRAQTRIDELKQINQNLSGWSMTLADQSLPKLVRDDIVDLYERAKLRKQNIEQLQASEQAIQNRINKVLDVNVVIRHLHQLETILAGFNPTLGNNELRKHIEGIFVHADGRIVMRGSLLGLMDGAVELLSRTDTTSTESDNAQRPNDQVMPRPRVHLRLPNLTEESRISADGVGAGLDSGRIGALPEALIWTESFVLDRTPTWAEANAKEVARERAAGKTHEKLAEHFGVSTPTIRETLKLASTLGLTNPQQPRKMPRRRWHEDHALEVARLKNDGMTMAELAKRFGKCEATIGYALAHAKKRPPTDQAPLDPKDGEERPESSDAPGRPDD